MSASAPGTPHACHGGGHGRRPRRSGAERWGPTADATGPASRPAGPRGLLGCWGPGGPGGPGISGDLR
eukprot:11586072-Alexandrium_andersonii.AAC.1